LKENVKEGNKNTIYIVAEKEKKIVPFVVHEENDIETRKIKRCLAGIGRYTREYDVGKLT